MPARKTAQGLKDHPMLHAINTALVQGQTSRQIASWAVPPVSFTAIARYKKSYVIPVLANADAIQALLTTTLHTKTPAYKDEFPASPVENQRVAQVIQENEQVIRREVQIPEQVAQTVIKAIEAAPILAIRENRIRAQQDRHRRMMMVVDARAVDMANVPGGDSGLLVRDFKGAGENMVEVHKLDTGLLTELREHEKQIAMELGQWQENVAAGSVSIQIVCPSAPDSDQRPRVSFQSDDAIQGSVEGFEEIGLNQGR